MLTGCPLEDKVMVTGRPLEHKAMVTGRPLEQCPPFTLTVMVWLLEFNAQSASGPVLRQSLHG